MELFDMIKHNSRIVVAEQDRIIMHEYAETGRKISIIVLGEL